MTVLFLREKKKKNIPSRDNPIHFYSLLAVSPTFIFSQSHSESLSLPSTSCPLVQSPLGKREREYGIQGDSPRKREDIRPQYLSLSLYRREQSGLFASRVFGSPSPFFLRPSTTRGRGIVAIYSWHRANYLPLSDGKHAICARDGMARMGRQRKILAGWNRTVIIGTGNGYW